MITNGSSCLLAVCFVCFTASAQTVYPSPQEHFAGVDTLTLLLSASEHHTDRWLTKR